ncbi:MAG: PaaI family thioesterase [Pseudomonadota bacterium]
MSETISRTVTWHDPAATFAAHDGLDGLAFLEAIVRGDIPQPPIAQSLDFRLVEVASGRAVFATEAQPFHFNPIGTVHGGLYGTVLDSCMSCAVHSTLEAGAGYTTVEYKVNIVRGLRPQDGVVRAEGTVVHRGRRIATAEGRIIGDGGRLFAHGTATCMILDGAG